MVPGSVCARSEPWGCQISPSTPIELLPPGAGLGQVKPGEERVLQLISRWQALPFPGELCFATSSYAPTGHEPHVQGVEPAFSGQALARQGPTASGATFGFSVPFPNRGLEPPAPTWAGSAEKGAVEMLGECSFSMCMYIGAAAAAKVNTTLPFPKMSSRNCKGSWSKNSVSDPLCFLSGEVYKPTSF